MSDLHIDSASVAATLKRNAERFALPLGPREIGRVIEAGDGIAMIDGLPGVMSEEMIRFSNGEYGMILNLERRYCGAVILGDHTRIQQGDIAERTGRVLDVPAGKELLGRVVTPLGAPIDGRGLINTKLRRQVETDGPGIVEREPVCEPLFTGLKSIDAMTAIGLGQRELIIGDRQTGKTTVAIDAILNQIGTGVVCVYVAIGQKLSTLTRWVDLLRSKGALKHTIVVAATASDTAAMQYIAPFAACSMAEHFRDNGGHAMIVYDDLTRHAIAYRELSLLLRRPPGREAYPGDIFYLHSRLLERAGKMHSERGGGSLSALPIVETQQGDYSAYIPTNLVSITDGQIYLDSALFHQGFRPAMNVGLSVSRVGGRAQWPAMQKVGLKLRMDLAQYREQVSFAELTTDLDEITMKQLHRGERLSEILKQPEHQPLPIDRQVCLVWAAVNGHLDSLALIDIARFQSEWFGLLESAYSDIGKNILETRDLTEASVHRLEDSIKQIKAVFTPTEEAAVLDGRRVVPSFEDHDRRLALSSTSAQTAANRGGM